MTGDAFLVCFVLFIGAFMAGNAMGTRNARKDYEPMLDKLLDLLEKASSQEREG